MPKQLNERVFIIDGHDLNVEERTGTYVLMEEQLTLIDTSASPSVPYIKEGLQEMGLSLAQVKYIIVTHIHLDHAGGAGLLLQECPDAKVVVHPKGARHLADPSRLIAGAKMVYGDKFEPLFDPIVPIPEDRLLIRTEGDHLEIGPDCLLEFWDTPGHAKHHFSIVHPGSNGIFAGDTVGIRYEQLAKDGIAFYLPSTSPNQFDPEAMQAAIERIRNACFDAIYFGHYSMSQEPGEALDQVEGWLRIFVEEAEAVKAAEGGPEQLAEKLTGRIKAHLLDLGVREDHNVFELIRLDLDVSSMGLMESISK